METFNYIWKLAGNNMEAIIASCALVLTIYQMRSAHKHNKLSVIPDISSYSETTNNGTSAYFEFKLKNNGLGPAKIKQFEILLNNIRIEDTEYKNLKGYVNSILQDKNRSVSVGTVATGKLMSIGEESRILSIKTEIKDVAELREVEDKLNNLDLEIHYQSIYDDNYVHSTLNS